MERARRLGVSLTRTRAHLAGAIALCCALVLPGTAARAQVSVTLDTLSGGSPLFAYSYSVTNLTAFDLAIISLDVPALPNALVNLAAPAGFGMDFDPGVGLLSFFEDADPATPQTFASGTTISGFTFQSPFAPGASSFMALDVMGNDSTGTTLAPSVTAQATVPEPGTLLLGLAALPGLLLPLRRRRSPSSQ